MKASRNARICEFFAANIKGEGLHDPPIALRKLLEQHTLFLHRRKVVGRCPILCDILGAPVDLVGLERFKGDSGVAKILKSQLVEIVSADVDVEILAPIILHPLVDHGAAGDEILDPVGAIAERRLQRGGADVALLARWVGALPPMLGQHIELPDNQRHLAISGAVEDERDFALARLLDLGDMAVIGANGRAVFLERLHREDHVLDSNRLAIMMMRALPRRRNVADEKSSGWLTASAISPYSLDTSSSDETSKVSEISPAPMASDPFTPATTSLKLSKVPMRDHPHLPAFGASGLT